MLSVAEAHARLLALFAPLPAEDVALAAAAGRVLAADAVASRDQPPFAASAMDGYALRAADARPGAVLRVIGVSRSGARFHGSVGPGEVVRIYTGAPLPEGADSVVIQEDVQSDGTRITLHADVVAGVHIRPASGDFAAGLRVAAPRRLTALDLTLLAAMNQPVLRVARKPVVALIPTGDELVVPGTEPGPDQILSSNSYGLKAMLEAAGAEARILPVARDTPESLMAVLDLAEGADVIVTLGGASVGDFDLVQATARDRGLSLDFYRVAIRPGKPLMAGRLGARILLGLPGNPVSALVCGRVFLIPAIERMLGLPGTLPAPIPARLAVPVEENGPRTHYMRAEVVAGPGGWTCTPAPRQDSSLVSVLAAANALMIRPPLDPARPPGHSVEFIWLV